LIINVDGDDLLVDPEQVDAVAQLLKDSDADFVTCEGLPFGAAAIGLRAQALAAVCARKKQTDTATGWGTFFKNDPSIKTRTLVFDDPELHHPEIRMTLDYDEDFQFFKTIFEELARQGKPNRLREALKLILSRPDIRALNSGLDEKYWEHFNSQAAQSE
jgi:spore coat polysaccharide biosynthesis protein SpsF